MVPRGLDHIVHAVRDLDAAAEFYRRAGFTVGARNKHTWGTHNHVVQLPGFFIEILTLAEPDKLGSDGLSEHFGRFNQNAIARGDGFSMLMLESSNIDVDAQEFNRNGIGRSSVLPFSRQAKTADGNTTTVGFSLLFAEDNASPNMGFALCQQHNPSAFWNPSFQTHANGANAVSGVIFVADQPMDHAGFLSAFSGVGMLDNHADGVTAHTPRGSIEIFKVAAFRDRFGASPNDIQGLKLVGLKISVKDLDQIEALLQKSGMACSRHEGRLVIAPDAAFGATLIFGD
jgi:catechol 2,3-dioxygenase-like lactoylglutathione lyase family enzyme